MSTSQTSRRTSLLLVLTVFIAVSVRILAFGGYSASDDDAYASLAYQMARGDFEVGTYAGPPVFPLRIGLLAPPHVYILINRNRVEALKSDYGSGYVLPGFHPYVRHEWSLRWTGYHAELYWVPTKPTSQL